MIRRARLGTRSRARIRKGGKLAQGRPSVSLARWREIVAEVKRRAGGRCEVWVEPRTDLRSYFRRHRLEIEVEWRCANRGYHPHHLVKRSAGGADDARNIVWICPPCHRMTDVPYAQGRLVLRREGDRVLGRIVSAPDKFAVRGQG